MRRIGRVSSFLIPVIALAVFMAGCATQEARKAEELKAKIRLVADEAWNKGNLDALDEIFATDCVFHRPPDPDIVGLEAYKESIRDGMKTLSDFELTLDEIIIEGETSAIHWSWKGTHTPTGKEITQTGVRIGHWVDGKLVEDWMYPDRLGFMQQVGFKIIPPEEQSGK
jgi:ketosteroid isomerase-like protein